MDEGITSSSIEALPLHVVHITTVHPVHDTRIFARECRSLVKVGARVALIAQARERHKVQDGVEIIGLPVLKGRLVRRLALPALALVKAFRRRADIYHFHDPELVPVGLLLWLLRRGRVIYDVHEYHSEIIALSAPLPLRKLVKAFWHLAIEAIPARLLDAAIFPTERLRREYAPQRSSVTVRNLPSMYDSTAHLPVAARESEKDIDVIFVGTVSPPRLRFMMAVVDELVARRPRLQWLFLGISAASMRWLKDNYDPAFLERHIMALPRVPLEEVLDYLARSRVGFNYHPMEKRFEVAIPMKVFEYMLMGVPVVSTALPELSDLLNNGTDAVLVHSDNPRDYADAIYTLLSDPSRAAEIASAGRARVLCSLNWESGEEQALLRLYSRLARGGKRAATS